MANPSSQKFYLKDRQINLQAYEIGGSNVAGCFRQGANRTVCEVILVVPAHIRDGQRITQGGVPAGPPPFLLPESVCSSRNTRFYHQKF